MKRIKRFIAALTGLAAVFLCSFYSTNEHPADKGGYFQYQKNTEIEVDDITDFEGFEKKNIFGGNKLIMAKETAWIALKNIDLNRIGSVGFAFANLESGVNGNVEIRLDGLKGLVIGKSTFKDGIPVKFIRDAKPHALYFIFKVKADVDRSRIILKSLSILRK
ncbi:carbohydrate-binding protein [Pedobacter sp. BMA]|uniref:carbohydrate-binding protein n=1 Tax=Pedobacter sp. BMA TaxID=1663685 RepID=UPI00064B5F76|nr:carbohydrate-binding protein [Pedobacter sp. BMA]KLT67344.1 hypothetical protein AB669_01135 [Pedobacter sp. BMA]